MVTANSFSHEATVTLWYRPSVSSPQNRSSLDLCCLTGRAAVTQQLVEQKQPGLSWHIWHRKWTFLQVVHCCPLLAMVLNTRGPCSSRLLRNVRKGHQILSAPPDRIAHTPLGELTGPPAVFKNNLEVQKVKSVTAAEERLQQVRFQQHQKGPHGAFAPLWYI